jgi:DNA anti-recombination protein RmuC
MLGMKLTIGISLTTAIIAGVVGWTANGWRLDAQINRMTTEYAQQLADANAQALARYQQMERQKQDAINEAQKLAKRNAAAASAARADVERLRSQLAASSHAVSTASVASLRQYTLTLSDVFGECVAEYERLAKTADGHALDVRTLINAWPK